MISSFRLYSGRREIVPGGTETVGGEDVTEIDEAAVERGPAPETLGRECGNRAMRQRRAEPAILGREPYLYAILDFSWSLCWSFTFYGFGFALK